MIEFTAMMGSNKKAASRRLHSLRLWRSSARAGSDHAIVAERACRSGDGLGSDPCPDIR
jgi:hypothetical protein